MLSRFLPYDFFHNYEHSLKHNIQEYCLKKDNIEGENCYLSGKYVYLELLALFNDVYFWRLVYKSDVTFTFLCFNGKHQNLIGIQSYVFVSLLP